MNHAATVAGASPSATDTALPALEIRGLSIALVGGGEPIPVVTGVDLTVGRQEIVGLVGESGSGKSLTSLATMGLLDPRGVRVLGGSVKLFGRDLLTLGESAMRAVRGQEIAMIFQDPMTSLDPAFTVEYQLVSLLRRHTELSRRAARDRAAELLGMVGIGDPRRRMKQYPHQFSGGMRQRVMIAMAISCAPKVLIADEPTTALDATTQAQILELIKHLADTLHMSTIITTHDLGVVAEVCDRVAVMYAGQVVEDATTEQLFYHPQHPYTERLLLALPRVGVAHDLQGIAGQPPRAGRFPPGCRFAPRCGYVQEPRCVTTPIPMHDITASRVEAVSGTSADSNALDPARATRCVRFDELSLEGVRS